MLTLNEYQTFTKTTAIYPHTKGIEYCTILLTEEAGECAGKVAKWIRDGAPLNDLKKELGDVLWSVARLADEVGWSLQEIMEESKQKLESRKERNTLSGSGDVR